MDAIAAAAPAASMVAVPATKATIISREASTASDALPLQLSGHLASVSTLGTTDVSPTSPAAVVHLSHRPSNDPALRTLFDDAPPPLDPVKYATPATTDAHSIEYIVPVQDRKSTRLTSSHKCASRMP